MKKDKETISTSHKFAKNSILNVLGFVITFPILIILTPYMLKMLGDARYGVWALAAVVTSYVQLSDMGMTTALVKFIAEHWTKQDVKRISSTVSSAFFSFAVVGGIAAGTILLLRHFIVVNLLRVPIELHDEALFVVTWIIVIFYFNLLFSVYNSVLLGIQRMDITNAISVFTKILKAIGMYLVLASGLGLKGLIINAAIISTLTICCNIIWSKKLVEGIKINPYFFSYKELKIIFKYSVNILMANLISLGQDPINKILIAAFTSLPFVAFYEIGSRVQQMVKQLFNVGLMPLLPATSELHSINNRHEIERIHLSISRFLYLFAVPLFMFTAGLADPLVKVWLGNGYQMAARAIQFLLMGHLISLLVTPQYIILQGIGKPKVNTYAHLLATSINIAISIPLILYIGFYGALIGGVTSLFISSLFIDYYFRRFTKVRLKSYISIVPFKVIGLTTLLVAVLQLFVTYLGIFQLHKILFISIVFFVIYLVIIKFGNLTSDRDWQILLNVKRALIPKKHEINNST
jgi:O-antigen/teichoic acid export membrane protein